jgi:hypothetical protein
VEKACKIKTIKLPVRPKLYTIVPSMLLLNNQVNLSERTGKNKIELNRPVYSNDSISLILSYLSVSLKCKAATNIMLSCKR